MNPSLPLRFLRANAALIGVVTLLGAGAGGGWAVLQTPQYEASNVAFVTTRSASTAPDLAVSNRSARKAMSSYAEIATAPRVLAPVIRDLQLDETPAGLAARVTAVAQPDSTLLTIRALDPSPVGAARIANEVETQLASTVAALTVGSRRSTGPDVRLTMIAPAMVPRTPASPNLPLSVGLGLLLGAAGGTAAAALLASRRRSGSATP